MTLAKESITFASRNKRHLFGGERMLIVKKGLGKSEKGKPKGSDYNGEGL